MDADGWELYRASRVEEPSGTSSEQLWQDLATGEMPAWWILNPPTRLSAWGSGLASPHVQCQRTCQCFLLESRAENSIPALQYLLGDLITVLPSDYHLHLPSDQITLNFLAAWGLICPEHWGTPVPEPSHGICIPLKKQSGFPWKTHDPQEYLKCVPLPLFFLNASSTST